MMLRGLALVGTMAAALLPATSTRAQAQPPPDGVTGPPPTAATAPPSTMGVLPLRAEGLQLNEANRLNLLLRARAGTRGGYRVQSEDVTNQLVEASQGLGVDCDINVVACGVELGKIADVDFVLLGRAVRLPPTGVTPSVIGLEVQLVDVKAGQGVRRVFGHLSLDRDQQTDDVGAYADALFGSARLPTLSLKVAPDGSTVTLDGSTVGTSPLATTEGLMPGTHFVVVEQKGYLPYQLGFVVAASEAAHLQVLLAVDPDAEREVISPLQIALPFIGAGVGGVVAITGGVLIASGVQPWFAHEQANADLAAAEADAAGVDDARFPERVALLNQESVRAAGEWQTTGLPTTVAGSVALGVGVVAVAAGLAWGLVLLTSDPEADVPTTTTTPTPP